MSSTWTTICCVIVGLLALLSSVLAQGTTTTSTSHSSSSGQTTTHGPSPTIPHPVDRPTYPVDFTTCFLPHVTPTPVFNPTGPFTPGAVCYEFLSTTGILKEIPLFTVSPSPTPSKSSSAPAIAGAVIGSVFAATAAIVAMIYYRRHKMRIKRAQNARRTAWVNRLGGWSNDNETNGYESKVSRNIALQNRSFDEPRGPV